eukprot:TRINITY_DN4400_c0_g1_i1.p1 TRINITY_DN4400_c0_g1~~TRINITY_DN4400_c0_g1_i1.p1  ORF type:complete len:506 (-),score=142.55 TRINITY_DN4400_c0_g1_i1:223-1740(-)
MSSDLLKSSAASLNVIAEDGATSLANEEEEEEEVFSSVSIAGTTSVPSSPANRPHDPIIDRHKALASQPISTMNMTPNLRESFGLDTTRISMSVDADDDYIVEAADFKLDEEEEEKKEEVDAKKVESIEEVQDENLEYYPQAKWKSLNLRHSQMERMTLSGPQLETMRRLRVLPPQNNANGTMPVCDLQVGDIVFVQDFNAVALSQTLTKVFSTGVTKFGHSESVHCMIVTDSNGVNVQVAHVTRDGGALAYIEDPVNPDEFVKLGMEPPAPSTEGFKGIAYRLTSLDEVRTKAADVATQLIEGYRISYSTKRGIGSVFRDPKVGHFLSAHHKRIFKQKQSKKLRRSQSLITTLDQIKKKLTSFESTAAHPAPETVFSAPPSIIGHEIEEKKEARTLSSTGRFTALGALTSADRSSAIEDQKTSAEVAPTSNVPLKVSLFCSEFVIKCYQEALAHIPRVLVDEDLRIMDIRGEACSPMALEGFLLVNESTFGDWQMIGRVQAEFM